jgi:hypothetical protein
MHLRYDEDFVESAVLLCAAGRRKGIPSLQIARFHVERERLYSILDPDDRNAGFFRLHLQWFREWNLERFLTEPLKEFPLLSSALSLLAFRKSRTKNDDGTELYVNEAGERSGVLAMRPERLVQEEELTAFLRHELMHLNDMVDPIFAYRPELSVSGHSLSDHRLARERYRMLWDVSIDGRLTRAGRGTMASQDQRWLEFAAAFAFWPQTRQQEVFHSLWSDPAPNHGLLEELVCDPRQLQQTSGPRPGAPCPLCGFPTFAWATFTAQADRAVGVIRSEFPHWAPEHGACARCFAIYRANHPQAQLTV